MAKLFNPMHWASLIPNGFGEIKPHHILETGQTMWDNKDALDYAWRILNKGVCDGCALGTTGMKDFTMEGLHLCTVRLNLLRLNTMPAMDPSLLADLSLLKGMSSKDLREKGRLPVPMLRFKGEKGFKPISWDFALSFLTRQIRQSKPDRLAFFLTSRGLLNETYYVAQKVARFLGTNHVDNAARICHSPSTVALKSTLGVAASTCSYKDWIGTDLLVFIGSNTPNNQPVTTKYMYYAKQAGTKIVVINPYKEPGLKRYWIPSVFESAIFGTTLADQFFQVHTGGDMAFLNGVLKYLIETDQLDPKFIEENTTGFEILKAHLAQQSWEDLETYSGATRDTMKDFGEMYAGAKSAIFVWSMGITQHSFGVENVKAIVNLALARGMLGKEHCGLMPIRGHSGVQGGGEMGCAPNILPGGAPLTPENRQRFEDLWGFEVPEHPGWMTADMLDQAHQGALDVFYAIGGNFLETMPDPDYIHEALSRVPVRVHQDIFVSTQMLVEPEHAVLLLPAETRYEMVGGGTETSTERQVIFSPEIPGPRIGQARPEWRVLQELAQRVKPEQADQINFENTQAIRNEIAQANPVYEGIQNLKKAGDVFQWGGRSLCDTYPLNTPDGKAQFSCLTPPELEVPEGYFALSSRRGKQFNSMVQKDRDPLTGGWRDDLFMSEQDAQSLSLAEGDPVRVLSDFGQIDLKAKVVPIKPRNLQIHWPEGNILLDKDRRSQASGVPDYNIYVRLENVSLASQG